LAGQRVEILQLAIPLVARNTDALLLQAAFRFATGRLLLPPILDRAAGGWRRGRQGQDSAERHSLEEVGQLRQGALLLSDEAGDSAGLCPTTLQHRPG
jgi:hypothetical protein